MANFSALKTAIQNAIRQNGNEEITGDLLQQILLSVVNTMGDGAINTIEQNLSGETLARQNGDNTLQSHIDAEALARGNADTQLQNAINAIKANIDNGYVYAGIATPSSMPVSGKVFYIATAAGTYTNFGGQVLTQGINILRFNGSAWSSQQLISIDEAPTAGSNSLVKSGGVDACIHGEVVDFSLLTPISYFITSNGIWNGSFGSYLIPTKSRIIKALNNTNKTLSVISLTSYPTVFTGAADICSGENAFITLVEGDDFYGKLPSDVSCIVVMERDTTGKTIHCDVTMYGDLSECSFSVSSFDAKPQNNSIKLLNSGGVKLVQDMIIGYIFGCGYAKNYVADEEIVLNNYDVINGRIIGQYYYYNANSKAYLVPATNIKTLEVTANNDYQANISLLMSKDFTNGKVHFAGSLESRTIIPHGETATFDIPTDCVYIYIDKISAENNNLEPDSVVVKSVNPPFTVTEQIAYIDNTKGKPSEGENGDMNLCLVSYDKEDSAQSYWYTPSVISTNYVHRNVYTTFTDHYGYTGVISENLFDHSVIKTKLKRMLGPNNVSDTHNSAFVSLLPDRRIICGYSGGHNQDNNLHIRISKRAEDITDFNDAIEIDFGGGTCYGQYFYIGGKHYVFLRVALKYWAYAVSEDLVTWNTHTLIESSEQYYLLLKPVKNDPNILRMAMYANAALTDTNIRAGYINFSNGNVLDNDGETVVGTLDGNTILSTDFTIVVPRTPVEDNELQRLQDVAYTNMSDLKILFSRKKSSLRYSGKNYIYENGQIVYLCDGGNPMLAGSGLLSGMAFVDDSNIIISRSDSSLDGYNYIEKWTKNDGTWSKTKEIYKELQLQSDGISYIRNGYPIVDVNGKILVWQRGYYPTYTDATMDSIFYDIDNENII